jgi:HK97 family phage major capsid protein
MAFDDVIGRPDASALIPIEQAREIIQLLPQSSVALRLARRAPNMSAHQRQVPVLSVLPMAYFVNGGDGGLKQTTKTGWEGLMLTAEEIAVIVPIHENVLNDSAYPLWQEIRPQIAAAIGLTLDRAVFFGGTGRPASWPPSVDQGARATLPASSMVVTRGGSTAALGGISGDLSNLYSAVERKGYEVSGLLLNPALWRGFIRQARNTQGDQLAELLNGAVYGFEPTYGLRGGWPAPGANVTEGFAGDFSQMIIAIREDMDWLISREAVITDENNDIVLNLFQADSVALRVKFRVAMQISQPVTPEQLTKANRYPFAVIQGTGAVGDLEADADAEAAEAEEEEEEETASSGSRRKR